MKIVEPDVQLWKQGDIEEYDFHIARCARVCYKSDKVDGNKLYIWWESEEEYGPWSTTFTISGNTMTTTEGGGTTWTRK